MTEYEILKKEVLLILVELGFQEEVSDRELDTIGSKQAIFVRGETRIMLEWDGEEKFGGIDYWDGEDWKEVGEGIPAFDDDQFSKNLEAQSDSLRRYISNFT